MSTAVSGWLPSGAPYVFTPLDLPDLVGWWDADAASTFTYSSGTSVSQWDSKVNGYNLVQATGASQPSRSGTINGLSSVVFDGTNDFLSVADFDMTGTQRVTIAVVMTAASSASFRIIVEHGTDGQDGAWTTFKNLSDKFAMQKTSTAGANSFETTGALSTTPKVVVGVHDGTLSSQETTVWMDNSNAGTRSNTANTNSGNVNATLRVGARQGTSLFLNGQIAELVITKSALSTTEREALQTYLADKWGITF